MLAADSHDLILDRIVFEGTLADLISARTGLTGEQLAAYVSGCAHVMSGSAVPAGTAAGGGSHEVRSLLATLGVGVLLGGLGLALMLDFRGFTRWHVRTTFRLIAPVDRRLRRRSPRRRLPANRSPEGRQRSQLFVERWVLGGAFTAVGGLACLIGLVGLIRLG